MHQGSPKATLRIPLELRSIEVAGTVAASSEILDLVSDQNGMLNVSSIRTNIT